MPRVEKTIRCWSQRVFEELFYVETEKHWKWCGLRFWTVSPVDNHLKANIKFRQGNLYLRAFIQSSLIILHNPFDQLLKCEAQLPLAILVIFERKPGNTDA